MGQIKKKTYATANQLEIKIKTVVSVNTFTHLQHLNESICLFLAQLFKVTNADPFQGKSSYKYWI